MKILSIYWGFSLGGIAKYAETIEQLHILVPVRLRSLVILPKGRNIDNSTLSALNAVIVPVDSVVAPSWILLVRKTIKIEKPDCIMSHGFNGHLVSLFAGFGRKKSLHRLASYHGNYHPPTVSKRFLAPIYNNFSIWFLKWKSASTICVAQYCADILIDNGVPADQLAVIYNGVPECPPVSGSRDDFRRRWGLDPDNVVIVTTSRLDPVKGLHYLVDAFAIVVNKFPTTRLVLIGDGSVRKALEQQVVSLGIQEKVLFTGIRADVSRCLLAMDIFALPSLAEYHSIGLLEAMRAGLPCIVTDVGGNTESVRNGREGLVVKSADAKAFATAMERLLNDSALTRRLGLAAHKRFINEFTKDAMLHKTAGWLKTNLSR